MILIISIFICFILYLFVREIIFLIFRRSILISSSERTSLIFIKIVTALLLNT